MLSLALTTGTAVQAQSADTANASPAAAMPYYLPYTPENFAPFRERWSPAYYLPPGQVGKCAPHVFLLFDAPARTRFSTGALMDIQGFKVTATDLEAMLATVGSAGRNRNAYAGAHDALSRLGNAMGCGSDNRALASLSPRLG